MHMGLSVIGKILFAESCDYTQHPASIDFGRAGNILIGSTCLHRSIIFLMYATYCDIEKRFISSTLTSGFAKTRRYRTSIDRVKQDATGCLLESACQEFTYLAATHVTRIAQQYLFMRVRCADVTPAVDTAQSRILLFDVKM